MRGIIFFLLYLILTSSNVSANQYENEKDIIFLQNNSEENNNFLNTLKVPSGEITENNDFFISDDHKSCSESTMSCPCKKCKIVLVTPGQTPSAYFRHESIVSMLQREPAEAKNTLDVFCDCFSDVQSLQKNYDDLKKNGLENSIEGLLVQADLAMTDKNYNKAEELYDKALKIEKNNEIIKTKLAFCFRKQKKYRLAEKIYIELLKKNTNSMEIKINFAYLEIDKKNYNKAIKKFQNILNENPDYKPAKMGLVYSYTSDAQYFNALRILHDMPKDEEVNSTKAYIYYTLGMYSDANNALKGYINEDNIELANQIKKMRAFNFTPSYTFLNQELTEIYDLDVRKVGLSVSEYGAKNLKGFLNYGMYVYISGNYNGDHLEDVTNEIQGGIEGRPKEKIAFRSDIGIKVFQTSGAMLITDSWIKYYANDKLRYKLGFFRNNLEQSYLSAVGFPIHGVFTGQVIANKAYAEMEGDLPKQYYYILKFNGGAMTAQNLPTNVFIDTFAILGKNFYDNHENKWIQHAGIEVMTNNASYQQYLTNIPGAIDSPKKIFGGYFSPSFYNANTINFKIEGAHKEWHMKYGLKGYVGYQCIFSPDFNSTVYGVYPYISYSLNDHVTVNLSYLYSNYSTLLKHYFMISVDIKGFDKIKLPKKKTEAHIIKS